MNEFPAIDIYNLKARLVPAIVATAPALALAVMLVTWRDLGLTDAVIVVAVTALLVVFADLARRFGKRVESGIHKELGGKPSTTLLRHRDDTLDPMTKNRYRTYLARRVGETAPTAEDEKNSPAQADAFYERCIHWLIEKTRDATKFSILFNENVTYGFRRNIYGLRWFGLAVNAAVVVLCVINYYSGDVFGISSDLDKTLIGVVTFALIHGGYLIVFATRSSVIDASKEYARRLLLSCETIMEEDIGRFGAVDKL